MSDLVNTFPNDNSNGNSNKKNKKKKIRLNYRRISTLLVALVVIVGTSKFAYNKLKTNEQVQSQQKVENLKKVQDETNAKAESDKQEKIKNSKVIYLTFDDGPNNNTEKVLDVLKKNDIKASFFLVGNMAKLHEDIVKKIYDDGHTIANHTYSHKYKYATKEEFIADVQKTDDVISEAIGKTYKSEFVRIPGGSMGKKMLKEAATANNEKIIDWTALTGDSEKAGKTTDYVMKRLKQTIGDNQYEVLLMHDVKNITVETLQQIIDYGKSQGYIFEPLTTDSPVQF